MNPTILRETQTEPSPIPMLQNSDGMAAQPMLQGKDRPARISKKPVQDEVHDWAEKNGWTLAGEEGERDTEEWTTQWEKDDLTLTVASDGSYEVQRDGQTIKKVQGHGFVDRGAEPDRAPTVDWSQMRGKSNESKSKKSAAARRRHGVSEADDDEDDPNEDPEADPDAQDNDDIVDPDAQDPDQDPDAEQPDADTEPETPQPSGSEQSGDDQTSNDPDAGKKLTIVVDPGPFDPEDLAASLAQASGKTAILVTPDQVVFSADNPEDQETFAKDIRFRGLTAETREMQEGEYADFLRDKGKSKKKRKK